VEAPTTETTHQAYQPLIRCRSAPEGNLEIYVDLIGNASTNVYNQEMGEMLSVGSQAELIALVNLVEEYAYLISSV